jgi:hypothetical protein
VSARTILLAGGAAALLAIVLAVIVFRAWYEGQPPPLDESGPPTALRMHSEPGGGVPPPRYTFRLANGSTTTLAMTGIWTQGDRTVAAVSVVPAAGEARQLTLAEGQSGQAGGVKVTVVHVWRMPDHANDAVDVRVVPTEGEA